MTVPVSNPEATPLHSGNSELGTLVIQTAHLGDVVLTLPLLAALAEGDGPLDVVTTPAAAPLVEFHPAVRHVIPYDKHGSDRGVAGLLRLGARLRAAGYRRAILPHESLRSSALALLARVPERIGFAGAAGALGYTRRVARPAEGHMSARLLALAGVARVPPRPWLHLTDADRAAAARWLEAARLGDGFVVLAPGARWATKRWPWFAELAARLTIPIVVIGGAEDGALSEAIVGAAARGGVHSAAGQLTLRESAAIIERSALVVCNDSVALHLASALGRPAVALFGPTATRFGFGPAGPEGLVLEHPSLPCRPCSAHGPAVCPLGHHRCMRELGTDAVAAAVVARLAALEAPAPGQ